MRAKLACLGGYTLVAQKLGKAVYQRASHVRRSGVDKRGAIALARVRIQREL